MGRLTMGLFELYPAAFFAAVLVVGAIGGWIAAEIKQRLRG
jgi:hypothetical protein